MHRQQIEPSSTWAIYWNTFTEGEGYHPSLTVVYLFFLRLFIDFFDKNVILYFTRKPIVNNQICWVIKVFFYRQVRLQLRLSKRVIIMDLRVSRDCNTIIVTHWFNKFVCFGIDNKLLFPFLETRLPKGEVTTRS